MRRCRRLLLLLLPQPSSRKNFIFSEGCANIQATRAAAAVAVIEAKAAAAALLVKLPDFSLIFSRYIFFCCCPKKEAQKIKRIFVKKRFKWVLRCRRRRRRVCVCVSVAQNTSYVLASAQPPNHPQHTHTHTERGG